MAYSETGDPIGDMLYKIVIAFVCILIIIFIFPVSLSTFGIFSCSGCDPITLAFVFGFLTIALVFMAIYFTWRHFK